MEIVYIILIIIICVVMYYGVTFYIKEIVSVIEEVLNDDKLTIKERIQKARYLCKNTNGIVFYIMFRLLDTIDKNIKYD